MKKLRFYLAITLARLIALILKLTGHNATHTPGALALKLCPDFLSHLAKPKTVIAITGTNGKTTSSNLIADLYKKLGFSFAHNSYGSNIKEGVITTLLDASTFFGGPKLELCILEVDERASRIIFPEMAPDYLLVTNLFRESYLRNAHGEFVFRVLKDHIPSHTHLILNSDDLISSRLGKDNPKTFYSISPLAEEKSQKGNLIEDMPLCPLCNQPMVYDFRRHHHIGRAHCSSCAFTNYKADFVLEDVGESFTINHKGRSEEYPILGENILDHYAELCALSLMRTLKFSHKELSQAIEGLEIVKSRKDISQVKEKTLYRMLAKGMNPIAISRALEIVLSQEGKKALVLLNDTSRKKDSHKENTAWLYDTDFEQLKSQDVDQILVGGYRAEDYYLRLLFAGIAEEKIILCEEKADVADKINLERVDFIGVLYELYSEPISRQIINKITKRLNEHPL
ncbi:MAG TPA: MurT ligase domain-containing protein [Clostridia bacterium]|nr:MurT ligase domain-containing protein [Clostridia bacterium]